MTSLSPFEGHDVIASGVEMPGAGGGLNKALRVNHLELHHGDRVVIVLDCEVTKLRFDSVKDTEALERVHVLRVDNATTIDEALVSEALEAQRIRVEEAQGVHRLPMDGDHTTDPDTPDPVAE